MHFYSNPIFSIGRTCKDQYNSLLMVLSFFYRRFENATCRKGIWIGSMEKKKKPFGKLHVMESFNTYRGPSINERTQVILI